MIQQQFQPEKITKPIQLLAAWLIGLIAVNGSFLLGAKQIVVPAWAPALLVIASVVNVPVFILALFLPQTKFRPQMQEDPYYAQYLKTEREYTQTKQNEGLPAEAMDESIRRAAEKITLKLGDIAIGQEQPIMTILRDSQIESLVVRFGDSRSLAELAESPITWQALVAKWGENKQFIQDIEALIAEGLVRKISDGYLNCSITELGKQVAIIARQRNLLWSQANATYWRQERDALANNV